jgi:hypothetical protein
MTIIAVMLLAVAGDHCFCKPAYVQPYYYPQKVQVEERTDKVVVVNRHIHLHAPNYKKVENPEVDEIVAAVMAEIPIPERKAPERVFQFAPTQLPMAAAAEKVEQRQVETRTETRLLYGQIQQAIAVHNGTVIVADGLISIGKSPVKVETHSHQNGHK